MYQSRVLRMLGSQRTKEKSERNQNILKGLLAILAFAFIITSAITAIGIAGALAYADSQIPDDLNIEPFNQSTFIYDRTGTIQLYELSGDERRTIVTYDEIPSVLVNATIALEDGKFFEHEGYDPESILRAAYTGVGGGSTITQQLVKRVFLTPDQTLERKVQELLIAIRIEQKYSKEEIMAAYLNQIFYGEQAYGVKAASERYFNKNLADITLAEAAVLVGIPQRPNGNNPFSGEKRDLLEDLGVDLENPESWREQKYLQYSEIVELSTDFAGAEATATEEAGVAPSIEGEIIATTKQVISSWRHRQIQTLDLMIQQGFITIEEAETALAQELIFQRSRIDILAPHFVLNRVIPELEERYGEKRIREGGLTVITSIDIELQNEAERIVRDQINQIRGPFNASNGAMVAMDPKTGQILAHVGSVDYFDEANDGNVDVASSFRQPGSSFKPFAYAAAFENGYHPETVVADIRSCFGNYCPRNYDGRFHGPVTLRGGLANSYNIPAVKAVYMGGIQATEDLALRMGVDNIEGRGELCGLAFSLGCAETSIYDMVEGYATFANMGRTQDAEVILQVFDNDGTILYDHIPDLGDQVLDPGTAYMIADILSDNGARAPAFGSRSDLVVSRRAAAKTGTTNDIKDNWTLGYTPDIVVGVWVGNNNGDPMSGRASGLTGAAPIWNQFMEASFRKIPESPWYGVPESLTSIQVDGLTGWLPNPENELNEGDFKSTLLLKRFINSLRVDNQRLVLEIDNRNGLIAGRGTPEANIEEKTYWQIAPAIPEGDSAYDLWASHIKEYVDGVCQNDPNHFFCVPTEESRAYATPDNKPLVTITSHNDGETISASTFELQAEALSPWPITRVEFFANGTQVQVFNTEQESYWYRFNLSDGYHDLEVRATDEQNVTGRKTITVRVNTQLAIEILAPTNSLITNNPNITFDLDVNAPAGLKDVRMIVDGTTATTITSAPFNPTLNLGEGSHTIIARARDEDNKTVDATINLTIDTIAPDPFSLAGSCNIEVGENCVIRYSPNDNGTGIARNELYATEPGGEIVLLQDTVPVVSYTFEPTIAGTYAFYVVTYDVAGNLRQSNIFTASVTN